MTYKEAYNHIFSQALREKRAWDKDKNDEFDIADALSHLIGNILKTNAMIYERKN